MGEGMGGLVFGTLLGPEATGPGRPLCGGFVGSVCFWFPCCTDHACCVCGVCGVGLLFENYIVDASILYKKQFPRYMNLDLVRALWPFGVVVCGTVSWFSRN